MKKIGIMGGTFNPIHNGHIELALKAYETLGLDKVLFLPSGKSYMKSHVLDSSHRARMVELAIESHPQFELSLIEVNREGNSYTFETLRELTAMNPDSQYFFIMGADTLYMIEKWRKPEEIYALSTLVVTVRDDFDMEDIRRKGDTLSQKGARIEYINMPPIDISSSRIRELVKQGKDISNMVPQSVCQYIKEEGLYIHG